MMQKKICLLGGFGVGKSSLIQRFVHGIFSDVYQTTIGVKIDKKQLSTPGGPVLLLVWDIYGKDDFQEIQTSYLKGASGFMFIADGTRGYTLNTALELYQTAMETEPGAARLLIINKTDLMQDWDIDQRKIATLEAGGWPIVRTSAKTGEGVELAFHQLLHQMIGGA
jgi:small GTP-binding protein